MANPVVGVIMGSTSDEPTMQKACAILDELQISYDVTVCSAHRNPQRTAEYATTAKDRGVKVDPASFELIATASGSSYAYMRTDVAPVARAFSRTRSKSSS